MVSRQRSVVVVSIRTLCSHLIVAGLHLLLAAWGNGGDLDAGTFKGLWWAVPSSTHPCGRVFRVLMLIALLIGLLVGLQGGGGGNELGWGRASMPLESV